jgi:UDP:flavonoid glycosyltransferase YjiC (YdhE family)
MRVLFTCMALSGHFHPLVPFARALADAGHEVAFAAPASFAPTVAHAGFRHFPAGLDRRNFEVFPQIRTWRGPGLPEFMRREVFCGLLPRHLVPDLLALAASWPPDLIVRESVAFGGCIAAEALGIPHALVSLLAAGDRVYADTAAPLDALRAEYGLPPDPDQAMRSRYLTLRPFPPRFQDPTLPISPTTHHLRPMLGDRSGPEELPGWIVDLPARPVVYVGLGTIFNDAAVFRAFLAGLRDEPLTLIVTVGRNQDPVDYGPQPDNVHIERYIPLSLLLSHCDVAVTNGGSGTLTAALTHGLPVVVVPISADQPENAARCAALGLGRVVQPADLTPDAAREAVLAVLADATNRANAERVRDEIAALPGPEYAVELLERLAAEQQPLLGATCNPAR